MAVVSRLAWPRSFLDEADVGPALEEMGRAGMAQCGIRGPVNVSIELQRNRDLESTNGASFLPMRVCLAQGATDSLAPGLKTADNPTSVSTICLGTGSVADGPRVFSSPRSTEPMHCGGLKSRGPFRGHQTSHGAAAKRCMANGHPERRRGISTRE
mgnify:CR=1 FL=1